MNDEALVIRARVYIGYYYIFKRKYSKAKKILTQQIEVSWCCSPINCFKCATEIDEEELVRIAEAALYRFIIQYLHTNIYSQKSSFHTITVLQHIFVSC